MTVPDPSSIACYFLKPVASASSFLGLPIHRSAKPPDQKEGLAERTGYLSKVVVSGRASDGRLKKLVALVLTRPEGLHVL